MSSSLAPFRLKPFFSPRPWGRRNLAPWYSSETIGDTVEPIGEAWLTGPLAIAETGIHAGQPLSQIATTDAEALLGKWSDESEFPLLIKFLFPDEKLSVQVHPDDEKARAIGQRRGKTECWYIMDAEPGSYVLCGLKPGVTAEQVRASVADNSMEELLTKIVVTPGEMIFVDAGTVHAIGPGLTVLETQQTSDTTYRMFDYGRPRELHLEQGIAVMKLTTAAGIIQPLLWPAGQLNSSGTKATATRLIQQKYFTVDRFDLAANSSVTLNDAIGKPHSLVVLKGSATLQDSLGNSLDLPAGTATVVPASEGTYSIRATEDFQCIRSMP